VDERTPDRRCHPQSLRSSRIVHLVGVLGTAGVALQPFECPKGTQITGVQPTKQVIDSVKYGRRVRLDRYPILRFEEVEPERGHDAHHRSARSLMPSDLYPRGVGTDPVCVVHERDGKPEDPFLDLRENLLLREDLRVVRVNKQVRHHSSPAPVAGIREVPACCGQQRASAAASRAASAYRRLTPIGVHEPESRAGSVGAAGPTQRKELSMACRPIWARG
jgi:hypothetical protein